MLIAIRSEELRRHKKWKTKRLYFFITTLIKMYLFSVRSELIEGQICNVSVASAAEQ
jgi:hypothetical protein